MISTNYSKDEQLLDYEILDYDTFHLNETGINDGRMRLPKRYDIAKFYKRNIRNRGKHRKGEYGQWKNKSKEDLLDFSDDFDWQITYSFPATKRNPNINGKNYGGKNVTFRRLYLILCEHYNGGNYFIDEYFESVYPYTVKPLIDERLNVIKEELLDVAESMFDNLDQVKINKDGSLNTRATRINKKAFNILKDYKSFAERWEESEGEDLARYIKEDIISCLTTGQLPCQFIQPKTSTQKRRRQLGLGATPLFSATEQLINSIQLFVNIKGNGKWQTQSGIQV